MIELSRHIKALLLENDCVIIPGLGGFIAHNRPAIYEKASNTFFPPMRAIGFNPQLTINDGVLVQSYMEAYDTDFPDATRKIEKVVDYLKKVLYTDGRVELNDLGTIYYNVNGSFEFEPFQHAFFSPQLYGLEEFRFPRLKKAAVKKPAVSYELHPVFTPHYQHSHRSLRHITGFVFRNAVAVTAAILLFFVLSVPVQNTYVDDANYASLGSIGIFHSIRDYSAATMDLSIAEASQPAEVQTAQTKKLLATDNDNKRKKQVKPVAIRTEYVPSKNAEKAVPATTKSTSVAQPKAATVTTMPNTTTKTTAAPTEAAKASVNKGNAKGYYIIISSLPNRSSAEKQLNKFKATGCKDAMIVESDGHFRIAYNRYADKSQAYQAISSLKQQEQFKSAWVFALK